MKTKKVFCDCFAPREVCGCPVHDKLPERYKEEIPEFEEKQIHIPDGQCTPAHSSRNKADPGPEGVPLVSQSPYSPDLNLLDRFLFRHIKMDLRGKDFSGPEDLSKAIQRSIRHISENTLVEELKITQITSRRCNCVSRGLYFSNPLKVVFILYITVFYLCTCNHYRMPYYMTMKQSTLFQIFQSIAPNGGLNLRIFPFPLVKSSPLNFENSTASLDIHGWANFS